jgi:hypothetical protein
MRTDPDLHGFVPGAFPCGRVAPARSRREFLARAGAGFGLLGLAGLLGTDRLLGAADSNPLSVRAPHFAPRARSVIWLFMNGGPSGFDLFDPKPELQRRHGQKLDGTGHKIDAFFGNPGPLLKSPFEFQRHGQCGQPVADVFPEIARHVDKLAFLKSCFAESNNHTPALLQMNTGVVRVGLPSAGAWTTYGLGSANQNLPGYVVMYDPRGAPIGGAPLWSSGFLPGGFQGTVFRSGPSPILNLTRPADLSAEAQRRQLDLLRGFNEAHAAERPGDAELQARIASYELAYNMQMAAPDAVDLNGETDSTRRLYGLDEPRTRAYGTQLLLARRLVERGVRFVQLYHGGANDIWDAHDDIEKNHRARAAEIDRPIAALLTDLEARGLLDETLVIWGGEFGRLPVSQGGKGRDHNPSGFLIWMAGGGIKGGVSVGQTDDFGHKAVDSPISVHDLHATVLHLLGLDHKRLTYLHNGRRFRLTDVAGELIRPILA